MNATSFSTSIWLRPKACIGLFGFDEFLCRGLKQRNLLDRNENLSCYPFLNHSKLIFRLLLCGPRNLSQAFGILHGQRAKRPGAFPLQALVPSLDLAIALRVSPYIPRLNYPQKASLKMLCEKRLQGSSKRGGLE
jgi:hypothetical protein